MFIYKKDPNPEGYFIDQLRPISITSPFFKLLEKILKNRMETLTNDQTIKEINKSQHGFRKNLCTETNLLRLLLDTKNLKESSNTKNKYILSIDIKQASDRVPWNPLFEKMKNHNYPETFIKTVQILYKDARIST